MDLSAHLPPVGITPVPEQPPLGAPPPSRWAGARLLIIPYLWGVTRCVGLCVYTHLCAYLCVSMSVCVYLCVCVSLRVSVCVYICGCVYL